MELTKFSEVIDLLEKSDSYLYQQEKLFVPVDGKTYIIHNVNQQSYEYILENSSLVPSIEIKKYTRLKPQEWTLEEEKIVLQNPKLKILEALLPHRTRDSIRYKLHKLKNEDKKP